MKTHLDHVDMRIITGCIDERLDAKVCLDAPYYVKFSHGYNMQKYIVPGLGDYGDRYFGTT